MLERIHFVELDDARLHLVLEVSICDSSPGQGAGFFLAGSCQD